MKSRLRSRRLVSEGELQIQNKTVSYRTYVNSASRHLRLTMKSDGYLDINLPKNGAKISIESILLRNADWILKAWENHQIESSCAFTPVFLDGGWIFYLGTRTSIEILESDSLKSSCLNNNILALRCSSDRVREIESSALLWLRKQAERYLSSKTIDLSSRLELKVQKINVKEMTTRWGSCSSLGVINLNWKLIMFPEKTIEYVILHELTHLLHPNHSKYFWACLAKYCPEYRTHKSLLNRNRSLLKLKCLKKSAFQRQGVGESTH